MIGLRVQEGYMPLGYMEDGVEHKIRLGFNSRNEPVMAFYVKATGEFIFQMSFDKEEVNCCKDFFNREDLFK